MDEVCLPFFRLPPIVASIDEFVRCVAPLVAPSSSLVPSASFYHPSASEAAHCTSTVTASYSSAILA